MAPAADPPARLLVVEDEPHLATALKLNLELEGYDVVTVGAAREAASQLVDPSGFNLILLDVMLPDMDGFDLCKRLRESGNRTPVLMLTARGAVTDRVAGLEAGADDYLTKPFELEELLARIRSLLRRRSWEREDEGEPGPILHLGRVTVNFDTHEVTREGAPVHLTKLELDLLRYLVSHPGRVISRDELQEQVWKVRYSANQRMVDNFILRLRRHFEADPSRPMYFVSVRGAGYKFVPPFQGTAPDRAD